MFDFVKNGENKIYPVSEEDILDAERELNLSFPFELREFYKNIGYVFLSGSKSHINRIMDPSSVCSFRLREYEYEDDPATESYDEFEDGKLVFFEVDSDVLFSIELTDEKKSKIYYYDTKIADSLEDFLIKMSENIMYYNDII